MVSSRKRALALLCAIVLIIVPLLTTLQSNTLYAATANRIKVYNIAKSVVASFTGGTISESEAKYKGAGQYMTVDEIKAAVEIEHKIRWEKAEAEKKAIWDQAEAEKHNADSSYIPKEYVGEDYSPLDYNEDTDWYNVANVEAIQGINFEKTSSYRYEDGKIVKYTDVDVTLITAKLISQPTDKEITVTVDAPNGLCQGVRIDGKNVDPNTNKVSVAKDNATRSIGICVEFGKALSKVEINGNEITEIPADNEGWVTFEGIADADSYTIKLYEGESDDITMLWVFDEETAKKYGYGEDAIVKNGKVELVSIRRAGEVIYNGESDVPGVSIDEETGYVMLKKGDDVIVKLIPDYGYQLKSISVNGQDLTPQESVSTFELQNIQGNIHFSGVFEKAEDVVTSTSKIATGSVITGGANAASSGNLSLTIADNANYKTDVTSAVNASKVEAVAALDLTLDNIVSKGDGSNWTTNITEFDKPISISMNVDVAALSDGETYGIVRDHNGVLTELEATYVDGVLTFETNQFSTYTLVKKSEASTVPETPGNQPNLPETGDSSNVMLWILMMVMALGTMIFIFRKSAKRV